MILTISSIDALISILLIILSYILGSIPYGLIISKTIYGIDIREHGSKNIGTTNTFRVLGKKAGILVFILDVFKGMIVIFLVKLLSELNVWYNPIELFIYGAAAIIGHCYSIFLDFKGGKAVATSLGVILVLTPLPAIACLVIFAITLLITGYVSLSSTFATLTVFIGTWLLHFIGVENATGINLLIGKTTLVLCILYTLLAALIIIKHRKNYIRLINGTENSFKKKKKNNEDN